MEQNCRRIKLEETATEVCAGLRTIKLEEANTEVCAGPHSMKIIYDGQQPSLRQPEPGLRQPDTQRWPRGLRQSLNDNCVHQHVEFGKWVRQAGSGRGDYSLCTRHGVNMRVLLLSPTVSSPHLARIFAKSSAVSSRRRSPKGRSRQDHLVHSEQVVLGKPAPPSGRGLQKLSLLS